MTGLDAADRPIGAPGRHDAAWLVLAVALSAFVYGSIIHNYFFGDDLYSLYKIVNGDLWAYLATPGEHLLLVRNALFYLCYRVFSADPAGYFWIVLATHLVNVALLFGILRTFTGSVLLAAFGAALSGASPVHEGTLGWYSVYGQVVAAGCILWVLFDLARLAAGSGVARGATIRWPLLLLVATNSFGVGMGVAIVMPLVV